MTLTVNDLIIKLSELPPEAKVYGYFKVGPRPGFPDMDGLHLDLRAEWTEAIDADGCWPANPHDPRAATVVSVEVSMQGGPLR